MKNDLLKIINHYGVLPQLKYFQSEVFELNEAIIRYEFASGDNATLEILEEMRKWDLLKFKQHIEEEFADVMVLLTQIKHYYKLDSERIKKIMEEKIARQLERMKNE